jgi:anti-sigma factor (TIGR02949 family)
MPDGSGHDGFHVPPPTTNSGSACAKYLVETLRYLNDDLEGQELEEFRSHLSSCSNCRAHLEKEKALSQLLRRSRPLYSAPASLRARVSAATEAPASISTATGRHDQSFLQTVAGVWWRFFRWRVLAPAAIAIALCVAFVPDIARNVRAASYVEAAVVEHRCYLNGSLPAGLASNSPQQVMAWFAGKVPFDFRLPTAESAPEDKPAYRLTGASVVSYKGSPAALVKYETQNEKISLLVDSSMVATVAGGDEVQFGKLIFHYRNDSGFRVITWNNHGLSYALVSSVSGPVQKSCLVCHQNMADRDNF